jgi:hypothetical protein
MKHLKHGMTTVRSLRGLTALLFSDMLHAAYRLKPT